MRQLLSLRQYALSRKARGLPGSSLAAVQKALKTGRIVKTDGGIDPAGADSRWEVGISHDAKVRRDVRRQSVQPVVGKQSAGSSHDFMASRARREGALAEMAELELRRRVGSLMPTADVERIVAGMITTARSRLLMLPDKLAPRVAVMSNVIECRQAIQDAVHEALLDLSEGKVTGSAA